MKRIEYQSEERIFKDVAYTPKLAGCPILSHINELCEMLVANIYFEI
jgi:hypothetical protein